MPGISPHNASYSHTASSVGHPMHARGQECLQQQKGWGGERERGGDGERGAERKEERKRKEEVAVDPSRK